MRRPRVLLLSLDVIGEQMAGPGIRSYELARAISSAADVRLAATDVPGGAELELPCTPYDRHSGRSLGPLLAEADAVVAQPQWPLVMRMLRRSGKSLIFDLYDIEPLETLEYTAGFRGTLKRKALAAFTVDRVNEALRIGDAFVCASETQRDLWLGAMLASGLIRPETYDEDPSFRSIIDTVPFGLPEVPPQLEADPWRSFEGIGSDDEVVLWNGGIWDWLDAATAIRAMAQLSERRSQAKLVFMGASDRYAGVRAAAEARELAHALGLLDKAVFFNEGWVPYDERGSWLLSAAAAVSCHVSNLETRFAFRTRLLDCFWAGLPVVCTGGDALADEVEREDLGVVVPEQEPGIVADALERVLERGRESYGPGLKIAADRYRWSEVAQPLRRYVSVSAGSAERFGRRPRRPSHQLRNTAYCTVVSALNATGMTDLGSRVFRNGSAPHQEDAAVESYPLA